MLLLALLAGCADECEQGWRLHRLHSVRHTDRVLVMAEGRVGEYASPDRLLDAGERAAAAADGDEEEEEEEDEHGIAIPPPRACSHGCGPSTWPTKTPSDCAIPR